MADIGKNIQQQMYYGANREIIMRARELRKNMTKAEKLLWLNLRKKRMNGYIFRRQHPIDRYIVDFYCHELKLVIEVDGGIHSQPEIAAHDVARTAEIKKFGIIIIRFTNEEVLSDINYVLESIKSKIKELKSRR